MRETRYTSSAVNGAVAVFTIRNAIDENDFVVTYAADSSPPAAAPLLKSLIIIDQDPWRGGGVSKKRVEGCMYCTYI